MRALLDDAAVLEDDDQVGVADGREAVRDHERRPAGEEGAERPLDLPLGADVDRGSRLVEDQDARVGEQGARERDELALAEREARAALLELRLVAVLEPQDEVVRRRPSVPRRTTSSGAASGRPKAMFSRTVPGEEEALLRDDAELAAQRGLGDVAQVDAVDRDPAVARVVEAGEQLRDRRLAGAGVSDERDGRPGGDVEVDPVQHLVAVAVAEAHVLEADVPVDVRRARARPAGRRPRAPRRARP